MAGLDVLIRSLLDSTGFDDLKQRLQESQGKLSDTTESANGFKDAIGSMGEQMLVAAGSILAVGKSFEFFKSAITDAIEAEQAVSRFEATNESLGKVTDENRQKNQAWLESMEAVTGEGKEKLVPLYQTLVSASGNAASAQAALQVAMGLAARGMGDASENVNALTKYMETGRVRGVSPLANEIRHLTNEGKTQAQVLEILGQKFGDAGASVNTNAMQVKRAQEQWKLFKEGIGEFGVALVQYLQPALKIAAEGIVALLVGVQKLWGNLGVIISGIPKFISALGAFKGGIAAGTKAMDDLRASQTKAFAAVDENATKTAEKLLGAFNKTSSGILSGTKSISDALKGWNVQQKSQIDLLATIQDKYKRLEIQAETSTSSRTSLETQMIALLTSENTELGKLKDTDGKVSMAILDNKKKIHDLSVAMDKDEEKVADEKWKQEIEDMKKEESAEAASFKRKLKIFEDSAKQKKNSDQDVLKAKIKALQDEIAAVGDATAKERGYYDDLADAEVQLAKKVAADKIAIEQAVAQGITTVGDDLFGQSKAWAIAKSIINTYQGFTAALAAPYPLDLVLPEIVLAEGLAEVAKIESTSSGFDDPRNDFAAYVGGQKWAKDMVNHFGAGAASAGFSNQVTNNSSSNTYNNQRSRGGDLHVHVGGMFDSADSASVRKLVRTLQVAGNYEGNRTPR